MSSLPENVVSIAPGEKFSFRCHSNVQCFTECCRELELILTPYDVLRIQNALQINSQQFLDKYALIEFDEQSQCPQVYLGMVDDGSASCPFVTKEGCLIYENRPGACRTYPVGRGAFLDEKGVQQQVYVLVKEDHCKGFSEETAYTVESWQTDQKIDNYNTHNDKMLRIYNHSFFINGGRLNQVQADNFILSLYSLDVFREKIRKMSETQQNVDKNLLTDDQALLDFAIEWFATRLDVKNCQKE